MTDSRYRRYEDCDIEHELFLGEFKFDPIKGNIEQNPFNLEYAFLIY